MSTIPSTVWIDRETAAIALNELQAFIEETDTKTVPGDIEQAIDDLNGALTTVAPRTHITRHGDIEECQIPGVPAGNVAIDYYHDIPRLLIHPDNEEEPTHIINLPSNESATAPDASETPPDRPVDDASPVSTLIAQLHTGEHDLIADATISTPEPELIELRHQAADGAVILQYDYGRAFRSDTDETFDFLL